MTEIFTNLWSNIESHNYLNTKKLNVNKKDVETLKQARRRFLIKPGVCLVLTLIFSRYRTKLWGLTKNHFVSNRMRINQINQESSLIKENINDKIIIEKSQKITIEYRNNFSDIDEANRIAINSSRTISSKKKNNIEYMNLSRVEPTISEQYFGFMEKYKKNVNKFASFKKVISKFTRKEKVYNQGENFLMTTKLIYIPFVILLIFSTYDLALTYVGLYFKYQPLVDEYNEYITLKNNKI